MSRHTEFFPSRFLLLLRFYSSRLILIINSKIISYNKFDWTSWTRYGLVMGALHTLKNTEKRSHTPIPRVEFELVIPVLDQYKTVSLLDSITSVNNIYHHQHQ
jgi:hypothetical protein